MLPTSGVLAWPLKMPVMPKASVHGGGGDSESFDVDRFYQQFYDRRVGDRALSEASDVSSLSTDLESLISEEV